MFPAVIVKGFRKHCLSYEIDGMEDEEEVGNVGSEHQSVSSECEVEHVFIPLRCHTIKCNCRQDLDW
jgi:hypothetical protein